MQTDYDITTKAKVKSLLGITGTTYDALFDMLIRQFPVTEFTSLSFKGGTETVPTWTMIDPNYYTRDDARGMLYAHQGFVRGFQNLRVTYKAGYKIDFTTEAPATHTLPIELASVATEIVAKKFQLRNAQGIASETTEGQSITNARDEGGTLSEEQKAILGTYVRHRI